MKIRNILPYAASLGLLLTACTSRPALPEFGIAQTDTVIGRAPMTYRIEYRFATIVNAAKSPALEAIENSVVNHFFGLEEFSGTAVEAAAESIRQTAEELDFPKGAPESLPSWEQGEISIESEGEVIDTLLRYTITRYSFTGGAHGNYDTTHHTYSLTSGDELSLADLLTDGQRERLGEAIRAKLYAHNDARNDQELIDRGFFPEYIAPTENFRITTEGMTFCYNPYEIGCYALGPVEVGFTHEELKKLK